VEASGSGQLLRCAQRHEHYLQGDGVCKFLNGLSLC
jgi:hypothetical protein